MSAEAPGTPAAAKIVVDGVGKSFGTGKALLPVIDGVSFSVADGEFVAIVGPSGCGKSTLMNIVAGFEQADTGSVRVDGALQTAPNRKGIVISQHGSVFPWLTVQQNLMFGLHGDSQNGAHKDAAALADHYAAMVGLKGFENAYPHELSGGMLKRAELARAFVVKPDILYMDEPAHAQRAAAHPRRRTAHRAADHARCRRGHCDGGPGDGAVAAAGNGPGQLRCRPAAPAQAHQPAGPGLA
jgi:ABC-type nitrate/sulfonate/bicarbonate transport system ATPase subunit